MKKIKNILLIDDDVVVNLINKMVIKLSDENIEVRSAINGSVALAMLKESIATESDPFPDLIFLDINMPEMDGWEFLEEYREMDVKRQRAKVILLTTSENPDDIEKANKYPEIQEYCNKPLTKEIISKLVDKYYPE